MASLSSSSPFSRYSSNSHRRWPVLSTNAGEGVSEGVFQLGEEACLVEELGRLEVCRALPQLCLGPLSARGIDAPPVSASERNRWCASLHEQHWRNFMKPKLACQQKCSRRVRTERWSHSPETIGHHRRLIKRMSGASIGGDSQELAALVRFIRHRLDTQTPPAYTTPPKSRHFVCRINRLSWDACRCPRLSLTSAWST